MDLPTDLWDKVLTYVEDPLDVYALWQVFPETVETACIQADRTFPAEWLDDPRPPSSQCTLLGVNHPYATHGEVRLGMPGPGPNEGAASWTTVHIWGDTYSFPSELPDGIDWTEVRNLVLRGTTHIEADWLRWFVHACPRLRSLSFHEMWPLTWPRGDDPAHLGMLSSLRELSFHGSFLDVDVLGPLLRQVTGLQALDLSHNPWTWEDVCTHLPQRTTTLCRLGLSALGTGGVPAATVERLLAQCPSLTTMVADYTHWKQGAWEHLLQRAWDRLSVRGNSWETLPHPTPVTVTSFTASYVRSDVLRTLLPTPSWRHLALDHCHRLPLDWFVRIGAAAPHLQSLSCVGCFCLQSGSLKVLLPTLPALRKLRIDHTMVTELPPHPQLELLGTTGGVLGDQCLQHLPSLRRLVLGHPSYPWRTATLAQWITPRPWFRHVWFRTDAQKDAFLAQFPHCEGSVHVGTLLEEPQPVGRI